MPVLFAATLFVSATLLFMVQPMVGKMVLPLLGGSPAAWNTCMVFFQALLLLGYLYSHHVTTKIEPRRQTGLHLAVLGVTLAWLALASVVSPDGSPIAVFRTLAPQGQSYPMFGVLALLVVAVGLPFLVVSTSAPLLQRWFAYTGHPSAADPYFLYAASNAGSLISLLGYPLLIEPSMTLANQAWLWAGGFVVLTVMVALCRNAANNPIRPVVPSRQKTKQAEAEPPLAPLPLLTKVRWVGFAFVPSSLMLGVTFHITTDIASVPLLWVIPLALYLLTFIIAFLKHKPDWYRPVIGNLSPVLTLLLVFVMVSNVTSREGFTPFMALGIHLVVYFFTALLMHSELARERPRDVRHLTQYFLWISIGGVAGGIFNALFAPMVFTQSIEYPIAIVVGCLLIPNLSDPEGEATAPTGYHRVARYVWDVTVPLAMAGLVWWFTTLNSYDGPRWFADTCFWFAEKLTWLIRACGIDGGVSISTIAILVVYAVPCMLCFFFIDRPIRFGLCVGAVLAVSQFQSRSDYIVASDRSFFGILKVERAYSGGGDIPNLTHMIYTVPSVQREAAAGMLAGGPGYALAEQKRDWGVVSSNRMPFYKLSHGTTLHGMQMADSEAATQFLTDPKLNPQRGRAAAQAHTTEAFLRDHARAFGSGSPWDALLLNGMRAAADYRHEPLTYYHRTGPVGEIFRRFREKSPGGHFAMVGLGTGSAAAYAVRGQKLTFYEIDPTVIKLVEDGKYFTYVNNARGGARVKIVLGDARLQLEATADRYDLLLVDAFSSDSIPVHLLTREAIELYKQRLAPGGLLALHISNRYIMLEPVVARLAEDANLVARVWSDSSEGYPGKAASSWVVLANSADDLGDEILGRHFDSRYAAVAGGFAFDAVNNVTPYTLYNFPWEPLLVLPEVEPWTDDYSDVMRVMRFEEIRRVRRFFGLPVPKFGRKD